MNIKNSFKIIKKKNKKIVSIVKERNYQKLLKQFSEIINVPEKVLSFQSYQILNEDYNNSNKKFYNFYSYISFIENLLKYLILSLSNFFFFKCNKHIKKYPIIIDDVNSQVESKRWVELSKYFSKICIVSYLDLKHINKKIDFFKFNKIDLLRKNDLNLNKKLKLLIFILKIFFFSIIEKKNFFLLINHILFIYLKYKYIFSKIKANYLIQEKFYNTSALKNYLFKINGGIITSCIQKNMLELSISSFINTDIFFSLGIDTANIIPCLSGKIKKSYPVGSLFMEDKIYKKKKKIKKNKNIDLLVIGINTKNNFNRFNINGNFVNNYYLFYKWLVKFSNKFPKIKITLKHHSNYSLYSNDNKELNILKNSNINIIIKDPNLNGSYGLVEKSKILCSFGSTMLIEYLGTGKVCYFIDPLKDNSQFFCLLPQLKPWIISNYPSFEKKIIKTLKTKKYNFNIQKNNKFCLESNSVSKKIYKYLIDYKNN